MSREWALGSLLLLGLAGSALAQNSPTTAPARDFATLTPVAVRELPDAVTVRVEDAESLVTLAGVAIPPNDAVSQVRAHEFLTALLAGEQVYVDELPRIGRRPAPRSGFGGEAACRALVFRAPDGLCVNLELVRQGYARFDDDDSLPNAAELRSAEAIARKTRKGVWSDRPLTRTAAEAAPAQPVSDSPPVASDSGSRASAADPGAKPVADAKSTVYVTRSGAKYHTRDCQHCRNRNATAITLTEARTRKLTPCLRCKPPS